MTLPRDQFSKICEETFGGIQALNRTKGEEYTGAEGLSNVHANFDRLSAKLQITPEKVLWVYLTKHLDGIENYINELGSPAARKLSEPIEGRIDDAILYLLLLKAMVIRRQLSGNEQESTSWVRAVRPDFTGESPADVIKALGNAGASKQEWPDSRGRY